MKRGEATVQGQRIQTAGPAITNSPAQTHISPCKATWQGGGRVRRGRRKRQETWRTQSRTHTSNLAVTLVLLRLLPVRTQTGTQGWRMRSMHVPFKPGREPQPQRCPLSSTPPAPHTYEVVWVAGVCVDANWTHEATLVGCRQAGVKAGGRLASHETTHWHVCCCCCIWAAL